MSTRTKLLALLTDNIGEYVSGQKIGEELRVSRNAIWKAMNQLRSEGYEIESKSSVGYRLKSKENLLTFDSIAGDLRYPCDLRVFEEIDSTNTYAKDVEVGLFKPLMVVADRQTAGRADWEEPLHHRPAQASI